MSSAAAGKLQQEWSKLQPEEVLSRAVRKFGISHLAFASSFGAEDQVIIDMICRHGLDIPVFTIDTGRLPQETYDLLDATRMHYGISMEVLFPERAPVEDMLQRFGANLFYDSVEKRRMCCRTRKVQPLERRLSSLDAWICGLRREQSVTRTGTGVVEWDEAFGLFKINPLAAFTEAEVFGYLLRHNVPSNALHRKGYPSIGCAPCTRAVEPGADIRSGRWWWEEAEHRECGLHVPNTNEKKSEHEPSRQA
ncbi:phosphoadenylyl-sulfate reductase [Pelodictyon luteolum]|uniref:Adenosine 5'-phosphosulfate reductase n=1 Tax=Chlorobium luteolum (strain DSM 273 / BCRC 81028 / 2530) TaxID=319225 RepID=Q3B2L6_CHLL3|nr:phosphoadenylyl-sulfate reductase [Pelodictyon luteolum]ABB24415.1 phosphoadenylylsulfate reductase (thioredoxin) [Pelodictyon luteolum DSM 273]